MESEAGNGRGDIRSVRSRGWCPFKDDLFLVYILHFLEHIRALEKLYLKDQIEKTLLK
jgi:hypothetical protein